MSDILSKAKEIENYVIEFRRKLHAHPELSGEEKNTQKLIIDELEELNVQYKK